jgi:two-component system alkaline phosphatase synthesis response regulator PhoP
MSKRHSILVVEDEENLQEALKLNLELEGYEVGGCLNGSSALDRIHQEHFDLIILDVMLPDMDGIQVCEAIRLQQYNTPILMLSAKGSSADRVLGLKKGADDYLAKPFNLEELLLRVEKLIRKNEQSQIKSDETDVVSFGKNRIDFPALNSVNHAGQSIALTKKEAMLLKLLMDNRNEVITRERILQTVWGYNVYPTTRTIDNFILNFRKYYEPNPRQPRHFLSVRGMGYKFVP